MSRPSTPACAGVLNFMHWSQLGRLTAGSDSGLHNPGGRALVFPEQKQGEGRLDLPRDGHENQIAELDGRN